VLRRAAGADVRARADADPLIHSVDEAIKVLAKKTNEFPEDKE
jgi:hypothetical protein